MKYEKNCLGKIIFPTYKIKKANSPIDTSCYPKLLWDQGIHQKDQIWCKITFSNEKAVITEILLCQRVFQAIFCLFTSQNTQSSNEFLKVNIQGQEPGMFAFNVAFV